MRPAAPPSPTAGGPLGRDSPGCPSPTPPMPERALLDRMRQVRAVREPSGKVSLCDAETGEALALHAHYSESGWVQLLLHAEGQLEDAVREITFTFLPVQDRARF